MEWRQVDSSAGAKIIRTWGCGVTFLWWLLRTLAVLLLSLLLQLPWLLKPLKKRLSLMLSCKVPEKRKST